MSGRRVLIAVSVCVSILLLAHCGIIEPTPTSRPATPSPPAGTPLPPGTTLPSPTLTPTLQGTADPSSIAGILAELEGLPIDEFFEQSYRQLQLRDPDTLFINGLAEEYGVPNDRFTNMSDDYVRETQQLESAILDLLHTYDRGALSPDQQLSYDVYECYLDNLVRGHDFMYYDYPVNSLTIWGKQNWLIDFMVNYQPITDQQDAEDYIARLSQIDTWVEQLLAGLELREQAGVVPPRYIIEESISQVEGHLCLRGSDSFDVEAIELYTSFREKLDQVEGVSTQERQILLDSALTEIEQTFIPAFLELRDYLVYLETVANNVPGLHKFPEGQAYYAYLLRQQTGTNLSPEQVHELGLSEVSHLQAEIQALAAELGYSQDISMAELEESLSAQSDYLERNALLAEFNRLITEANQAADSFFDLLPSAELVIQREPFGSGIGYYLPPPSDGSDPGVFYTNLANPLVRYIIPSFVFHETVPGHHVQGALARELDLPTFRRELDLNGYSEGWAVYAERLAWEMGLYEDDPLGNVGRLQFELSRAARLVIDSGIHAKGWTRQEAAAYYEEATGRATSPSSMHRYIILPGQGCGYTIGLLQILELRQRAMDQLGDAFGIKEFHNVILGNGPLPLEILEQVVNDWIEAKVTAIPAPTRLPEIVLLEPMNYQEQGSSSSANTSIAILLGYYDHWVTQEEIDEHLTPIVGGMVWCDFSQYASQYDLMIRPYAPPFREAVRLLIAHGIPVIVGLQESAGSSAIYFRVFRGYDDGAGEFIVADPQQGPEIRISYGTFARVSEQGVFIPVYPREMDALVETLMGAYTVFSEHYCPDVP